MAKANDQTIGGVPVTKAAIAVVATPAVVATTVSVASPSPAPLSRVGLALASIEAEITMLEDTLHTFADHEKAAIAQYIGTLKTRLRAFVLRIGL